MPESTAAADRLNQIDHEIDLLETLQQINSQLGLFKDRFEKLSQGPRTGDAGVDFELDQLKALLGQLSESLQELTEPLNAASDLAGQLSGAVKAITALTTALDAVEGASGAAKVTAMGEFFNGWNAAIPLLGQVLEGLSINPVIGAYLYVLGQAIQAIGESIARIESSTVVRNDAIKLFDQVVEGEYPDAPPVQVTEHVADAAEANLLHLYQERRRLIEERDATNFRAAVQTVARSSGTSAELIAHEEAELSAWEQEWAELSVAAGSMTGPQRSAAVDRLNTLTDRIRARRTRLTEFYRQVREVLDRYAPSTPSRFGSFKVGAIGCLPFVAIVLVLALLTIGAFAFFNTDDGESSTNQTTPASTEASVPTTSGTIVTTSSAPAVTSPPPTTPAPTTTLAPANQTVVAVNGCFGVAHSRNSDFTDADNQPVPGLSVLLVGMQLPNVPAGTIVRVVVNGPSGERIGTARVGATGDVLVPIGIDAFGKYVHVRTELVGVDSVSPVNAEDNLWQGIAYNVSALEPSC